MDLKKTLNLNSYEWWRNHRRFVTLGIFLALFGGYLRGPSANDFKVRQICGRFEASDLIEKEYKKAQKQLGLKRSKALDDFCHGYKN